MDAETIKLILFCATGLVQLAERVVPLFDTTSTDAEMQALLADAKARVATASTAFDAVLAQLAA